MAVGEGQVESWRHDLVIENEASRILRGQRFKYAVYDHGEPRELLLDLQNDPGEMHNLATDPKYHDVLADHRARLQEWYRQHRETLDEKFAREADPHAPRPTPHAAATVPLAPRPAPSKPNVVFLLADQWRAQALGCMGDPNAKTPHLDRLSTQGVTLTTAVSTCPVCSP